MTDPLPQLDERLAWEGVVDGPTALLIALAVAILAAASLWRERRAIGPGWAATFWALRAAAFGCALWMLAGPTHLRIERTTSSQSIAVFADSSESMDVVDPPDASESLRWALAMDGYADTSPLVRCDRLGVSLGAALGDSQRLADLVKEHRPAGQLEALAAMIAAAVDRAQSHAAALVSELGREDDLLAERAAQIAALLDGPAADSLSHVRSALAKADRSAGGQFTTRVEQLVESLASARRRTLVLAADLARHQAAEDSTRAAAVEELSRREKVAGALDVLERRLSGKLADNVRIERFRFERSVSPVGVDAGWTESLQRSTPDDVASDDSEPFEPEAERPIVDAATNLSAVLERLASQRAGHATRVALVVSDGRHNYPEAPAPHELATQLGGVPIFVVPIGSSTKQRDVLLHRVEAPSTVLEKDSAVIDVIVTAFDCEGETSAVVLRQEGQEIDRQPIEFTAGRGDHRVRFMVPADKPGWQEYVVEVEPVEGETNTANNYQPVSFEVVRSSLRVLLAEGVARWEYRYLNQLFRRDERVQYDELLFSPRPHGFGSLAARPELPRDMAGWARYDVVILGDIGPRQLSADSQRALVEHVRTGGGNLILLAGPNAMPAAFEGQPLMELLPVEKTRGQSPHDGYALRLTDEGRFNSALLIADSPHESFETWQQVYHRFPVYGLSEYSRPKPTARTLIEAVAGATEAGRKAAVIADDSRDVDHAFLCWQRVGAGRVAYLAAPETYRLRWRRGDRLHHRFWGQFLRWIIAAQTGAGTDLVRLQTDRTRYIRGEPVEVTVWLKDATGRPLEAETVHAEARTFHDDVQSLELTPDALVPGRYFGTLSDLPVGAYQLGVRGPVIDQLLPAGSLAADASTTITVAAPDNLEMLNTQANRPLLEQLAEITGGQLIPPTAMSEVLELVSFTPQVTENIQREPLWNRWSYLFLVLGCLFTEWAVRKAKGLV